MTVDGRPVYYNRKMGKLENRKMGTGGLFYYLSISLRFVEAK